MFGSPFKTKIGGNVSIFLTRAGFVVPRAGFLQAGFPCGSLFESRDG